MYNDIVQIISLAVAVCLAGDRAVKAGLQIAARQQIGMHARIVVIGVVIRIRHECDIKRQEAVGKVFQPLALLTGAAVRQRIGRRIVLDLCCISVRIDDADFRRADIVSEFVAHERGKGKAVVIGVLHCRIADPLFGNVCVSEDIPVAADSPFRRNDEGLLADEVRKIKAFAGHTPGIVSRLARRIQRHGAEIAIPCQDRIDKMLLGTLRALLGIAQIFE